jgi:hypothetical protein
MRTRTIIISLLAVYAMVLTGYVGWRALTTSSTSLSGSRTASTSDFTLPTPPPFQGANSTASAPLSGPELLARVQIENELRYTDLQSFVCNEHLDRFRAHYNGENPRQIDTVTAQVSFENGVESYSAIEQNNRARNSMNEIPGAWSEGEFGTLLRQTRTLLTTQPLTSQTTTGPDNEPAVLYSLHVDGEDSPWELIVARQKFRVPFLTEVTVSQKTGRILQIKRTSTAMPPSFGISEIQWSVNLKPVPLDGKEFLLPTTGEYSILYEKTNRREWNAITFANYHRYTASSVMHF